MVIDRSFCWVCWMMKKVCAEVFNVIGCLRVAIAECDPCGGLGHRVAITGWSRLASTGQEVQQPLHLGDTIENQPRSAS
jgi:hypothetical protein